MNAYAEIGLAVYIVAVLIAKNEQKLIDMLKTESGFFPLGDCSDDRRGIY
jgi:hypothetical protein